MVDLESARYLAWSLAFLAEQKLQIEPTSTAANTIRDLCDECDQIETLRLGVKSFYHVRKTQENAHKKEMEESKCYQRMERAIAETLVFKEKLDKAWDGFYEIIMICGEETRKWAGWTVEEQGHRIYKKASEVKKEIEDHRNPSKVVGDIKR